MTSVFKRIPAHALALALAIGKHVAMSDHYRNRQETENTSHLSESAYFTLPVLSYVLLNPRGQTNGQMDGQTADGLTEKPSAK